MNWAVLTLSLAVLCLGVSQLSLIRTVRLLSRRLDNTTTVTVEMWGAGGGGGTAAVEGGSL